MARQNGGILSRKIQRLGASSLIVTLPKDWARRNGVKVGDILKIYDSGDKLIIAPDGKIPKISLKMNLSHYNVEKHAPRLVLCSYTFGYDELIYYSSKNIKENVIERLRKVEAMLEGVRMNVIHRHTININFNYNNDNVFDIMIEYGRSISRVLNKLSGFLDGNVVYTKEELDKEYAILQNTNYKLLRAANKAHVIDMHQDRQARYLASASDLIGLVNDSVYKLGIDILYMADLLSDSEKQRLSFLLQVLEVAVSTVVNSINPPSVKKAEESYWKVRSILDLEGNLREVVESDSPAFAYLLAKIIDIARIIEIVENVILCHALISKFNEAEPGESR
ncbi:MAG: AbrB/MazE/SpoVT family DNA-binding domain-containing protein [Desulfurococcales archaeon]|nr:AbrB/MazE/SpoVT family DNA-binding domain-containing protein [Desulfurococcales archaeon]